MRRSSLVMLLLCSVASVFTVLALYAMSDHMTQRVGAFVRILPPHPVRHAGTLNINISRPYIAGQSKDHIYVGNEDAPLRLLKIKKDNLSDTSLAVMTIHNGERLRHYNARVSVHNKKFILTDGAIPYLFTGNTRDWIAKRQASERIYFQDIVPISDNSYVLKSLSMARKENIIVKYNPLSGSLSTHPHVLEKQVDGMFCTDGTLHYELLSHKVVYVYFYRNQYIVADTNLSVLYRANTIDTVSKANIRVETISKDSISSKRLAVPPVSINKHSCVYKNYLLVHSTVISQNESKKIFFDNEVVDVYDFTASEYLFSFYIPRNAGLRLNDLSIMDERLYVLYKDKLDCYTLNKENFTR